MSIASLLSIKVTSPITHMVSSAVRGVAASFLGVWLFHDIITTCVRLFFRSGMLTLTRTCSGRAASIATILAGSVYYTWVKHVESQAPAPPKAAKDTYERVPLDELEKGAAGNGKPE